jgi:hypothetical protein
MADLVRISDLAQRLGVDVSTIRRLIQQSAAELGLAPTKGKQNVIYLTAEDADLLASHYETRSSRSAVSQDEGRSFSRFGFFYIVQLVPEALPERVKIGYTDNLDNRMAEHRCAAPTARLARSWRCKRSWDYAAMDSITRTGCKLVLNEVYEGDLQGFIDRAEAFFQVMPESGADVPLSDYSPLRENS